MKHYIFTTEEEAQAYDSQVTNLKNYQDPEMNWANPYKHPTLEKWAIAYSPLVSIEGKEAVELGSDWTPPLEDV